MANDPVLIAYVAKDCPGKKSRWLRMMPLALVLLALGGLASVAGSEAVLPAYLVGMALAPAFLNDPELPHRMRIIAFTILTPFYFLKAGSLVDFHAVAASAGLIVVFLAIKMAQ